MVEKQVQARLGYSLKQIVAMVAGMPDNNEVGKEQETVSSIIASWCMMRMYMNVVKMVALIFLFTAARPLRILTLTM